MEKLLEIFYNDNKKISAIETKYLSYNKLPYIVLNDKNRKVEENKYEF
jgi:hypothetical protein